MGAPFALRVVVPARLRIAGLGAPMYARPMRFLDWLRPAVRPDFPQPDQQTFLLWEPCSASHGEIVPGYASYLRALGYKVVVLMTPDRIEEGLFSRFDMQGITLSRLTQKQIRRLMRQGGAQGAAGVLVSTAGKLPDRPDGTVDLDAVFGGIAPGRVLLVEHDAKGRIDAGAWSPCMITLRELEYQGQPSIVVNPHDFGQVTLKDKVAGRAVFVMVGAARAKRRNQNMVFDAAGTLLDQGVTDFEIRMIGKPGGDPLPDRLKDHVIQLGRLDFTQMYDEVERADFVLTAFQGDNPDHDFYRTTGTTGAFQLCYGFAKPCVVQERFCHLTALNGDNSLTYGTDAEMAACLRAGVEMGTEDYAAKRDAMQRDAAALRAASLTALKGLIDG